LQGGFGHPVLNFMMDQIHAKQVIDVVDKSTDQQINGKKTFSTKTNFLNQGSSFHMVIDQGFIYWVTDVNNYDQEGNARLGMIDGTIKLQSYSGGSWNKLRLS
jgi:hypothetical protein